MRLSDLRGEDAIDVLAEIIDPLQAILGDKDVQAKWRNKGTVADCMKIALKNHKHEVIEVLAALDHKTYDEYVDSVTILTLPVRALQLAKDKDLIDFFTESQMMTVVESSGDATENTEEQA